MTPHPWLHFGAIALTQRHPVVRFDSQAALIQPLFDISLSLRVLQHNRSVRVPMSECLAFHSCRVYMPSIRAAYILSAVEVL
jgi:hypothetical protein